MMDPRLEDHPLIITTRLSVNCLPWRLTFYLFHVCLCEWACVFEQMRSNHVIRCASRIMSTMISNELHIRLQNAAFLCSSRCFSSFYLRLLIRLSLLSMTDVSSSKRVTVTTRTHTSRLIRYAYKSRHHILRFDKVCIFWGWIEGKLMELGIRPSV